MRLFYLYYREDYKPDNGSIQSGRYEVKRKRYDSFVEHDIKEKAKPG